LEKSFVYVKNILVDLRVFASVNVIGLTRYCNSC